MVKKILVTGGLGFIGTHLVEMLSEGDCEIDIVDNLTNNSVIPEDISSDKIRKVYTCSVEEFNFDSKKYDEIYHLASPVGPAGVLNYAGIMGQMIINDALKIAKYSAENNAATVFISTSEVYGKDPGNEAQKEDIEKIVPAKITVRLEYGVAKMLKEICVHNFALKYPFKYNLIRPFNIVGTGQSSKAGFIVPRFVQQALDGRDITIFGDGTQRRTFTHVKDINEGIIKIMRSNISGEVFNVGNPANEVSVKEVAEIVKKLTNSNSKLVFVDPKKVYGEHYEEAWNKIPNISKIKSMVGWNPRYAFEEIVQEVIDDCLRMRKANKTRPNQE
ncbi:MAG: NAD-dependent epimerase/dehydratase family protein [Patescibacteria group bacterium]